MSTSKSLPCSPQRGRPPPRNIPQHHNRSARTLFTTTDSSVQHADHDSDALALVTMLRHTAEGAETEFDSYIRLHGDKPKRNAVSREPTETQCLSALVIDECVSIVDRNITNRREGLARDNRLPTTQIGPMTTDVGLVAHRCDILAAAGMTLPVHLVGMGFQNIGGVLENMALDRDVHSHHQTRDKAVDFWWCPVGYVWMYGSYLHTPETVCTLLRELDRDGVRREFLNHRGQTERIVSSAPYESGAFIISELNLAVLLDALRQVPAATGHEVVPSESHLVRDLQQTPSHAGDQRRRHVIRYAYGRDTLAQLDNLRPIAQLLERLHAGRTDFTIDEIAALEHFQMRRHYRAVAIDGPPRTLPYGAYVITHISGQAYDRAAVQNCQQTDSSAIHATVRRTTAGNTPGRLDQDKQARYDSIISMSRLSSATSSPMMLHQSGTPPSQFNLSMH